jgi:glucokinase (EC 2.7.1.2)
MEKRWIFAIDLGGTTTKLALLTEDGTLQEKWEIPTNLEGKGSHIVSDIGQAFDSALERFGLERASFIGAGMGAPGPVVKGGVIKKAVNIGWENYPLQKELEKVLGLPSFVENDANCAALGEMWKGAGRGMENVVCVTLGTGVGGGVIVNGEVVSGAGGAGGEIGHMTVQPENGYMCNCGKTGCLETVASATGVVRLAGEKLKSWDQPSPLKDLYEKKGSLTSKDVFDLAEADPISAYVVDRVAYYLGSAFAAIGALLNPQAIIVGGGVSKAGDKLLNPVRTYYERFAFPASKSDTKILRATLGNDAGVFGAGWLVRKGQFLTA